MKCESKIELILRWDISSWYLLHVARQAKLSLGCLMSYSSKLVHRILFKVEVEILLKPRETFVSFIFFICPFHWKEAKRIIDTTLSPVFKVQVWCGIWSTCLSTMHFNVAATCCVCSPGFNNSLECLKTYPWQKNPCNKFRCTHILGSLEWFSVAVLQKTGSEQEAGQPLSIVKW